MVERKVDRPPAHAQAHLQVDELRGILHCEEEQHRDEANRQPKSASLKIAAARERRWEARCGTASG